MVTFEILFSQVQGAGNVAAVCVKQEKLLRVFSLRVIDVLTRQADNSIPLSKFSTAYEKLFSQKLCVQNFGCASLDDLLSVVSSVAKVGKIFNRNFYSYFPCPLCDWWLQFYVCSCLTHTARSCTITTLLNSLSKATYPKSKLAGQSGSFEN